MKHYLKKTAVLLLLAFGCWAFASKRAVAAAVPVIADIKIGGPVSVSEKTILAILPFKVGDPFDAKQIGEAEDILEKWGIFDLVFIDAAETPDGIHILIQLHQAEVISQINVSGNYPYIRKQVRKRIAIEVGDIYVPEKIGAQKEKIIDFYSRRGFYNTQVDTSVEPAAENNTLNVAYQIYKGNKLRYDRVEFEGQKAFMHGRFYRFIRPMNIYSERRLKTALQELVQFLRGRGYLRAKARVIDRQIDWERNRVSVKIQITEGPKVDIFFPGKKPYRLKTLKETVTLYREGHFNVLELQESREALLKRLHSDGYLQAKVRYKLERADPDYIKAFFYIDAGAKSSIASIDFSGNESLSENRLKKQLRTQEKSLTQRGIYEPDKLGEDAKIITYYYQTKGFPDVEVKPAEVTLSPSGFTYDVLFPIEEGPLVTVRSVIFEGNHSFPKEKLEKNLKNREGEPLDTLQYLSDKENLELFYANNGYPYASVKQGIERHEDAITFTYTIEEGPPVTLGEILIVGDVLTSTRAVRQAMGIRTGDPYSRQKVIEAQLNLRRLGAFDAVSIMPIGLEEKKTTILLKVTVEEREPFVVDMDAQYSTDLQYSGTLKFTNYNSFGWGKRTGLLFMGGKQKNRAELSWFDPRFAANDIQMSLSSWMDYTRMPVETTLQAGGAVSFFRQFHRFGFLTRYELTRSYPFSGPAANPLALRDNTFSKIGATGSYDVRNSFADPKRGFIVSGGGTVFNEILGLGNNFAKLRGAFNYLIPVLHRLTLSNTLRLDNILNIGTTTIVPQNEVLTLGGDDTVRGFKEDRIGPLDAQGRPLGGRVRLIYNAELRFRLAGALQAAGFFDMGSLTNAFSQIDDGTLRRSAGGGLRYITPAGPIRVDYGVILDRKPGENFGRLHITFGYPF